MGRSNRDHFQAELIKSLWKSSILSLFHPLLMRCKGFSVGFQRPRDWWGYSIAGAWVSEWLCRPCTVGHRPLPASTRWIWYKREIRMNLSVFLIPLLPPAERWTNSECLIRKIKLLWLTLLCRQTTRRISPLVLFNMWGKLVSRALGQDICLPITTFYGPLLRIG